MQSPSISPVVPAVCAAREFPALHSLGLSEAELTALRQQGFVSREVRRPEGIVIYKLRYRIGGRQRTRYLGRDQSFIEAVRDELAHLQADAKRDQKRRQVLRRAARVLRQSRSTLAPLLSEAGYYFHGLTILTGARPVSALTTSLDVHS